MPSNPVLPSRPQLVRFRKRLEKAHEQLDAASWSILEALRVYDGDKIQTKYPHAMAWENAHSVEAAIGCLKALLAVAETEASDALKSGETP